MGFTEKQQDKFSREKEKKLHTMLDKGKNAPKDEVAHIQLEAAKEMLKNTEAGDMMKGQPTIPKKPDADNQELAKEFNKRTRKQFLDNVEKCKDQIPDYENKRKVWSGWSKTEKTE